MPHTHLISSAEKQVFIENLSTLLNAGVEILAAMDTIKQDMRSSALKKDIEIIAEKIANGSYLWEAFDSIEFFPANVITLVKIGEESGRLPENLDLIAKQQEKDRILVSKIKSALAYPIIILTITLVLSIGVSWFILPRLAVVFSDLNVDLPLPTRIMISIGNLFQSYGYIVIPGIILIIGAFIYLVFINTKTKYATQDLLLHVPAIGNLIVEIEMIRFGFIVGSLLGAGLSILDAFDSLIDATNLPSYKRFYNSIRTDLEEGKSIEFALKNNKSQDKIPIIVKQIIVSGEYSGKLAETFMRFSQIYETKSDETSKNLTIVLEPILLILVGIGVFFLAISVILPIYTLTGGITAY